MMALGVLVTTASRVVQAATVSTKLFRCRDLRPLRIYRRSHGFFAGSLAVEDDATVNTPSVPTAKDVFSWQSVQSNTSLRAKLEQISSEICDRLCVLTGLGCTSEQIRERPQILLLEATQLQRLAAFLGNYNVTVMLLELTTVAMPLPTTKVIERIEEHQRIMGKHDRLGLLVAEKLQCGVQDITPLERSRLLQTETAETIQRKFEVLTQVDISVQELIDHADALASVKVSTLQKRLADWPNDSIPTFSRLLYRGAKQKPKVSNVETDTKYQVLAALLKVDVDDIPELLSRDKVRNRNLSAANLNRIEGKVRFLLHSGIAVKDIRNNCAILRYSLALLQRNVWEVQKMISVDNPGLEISSRLVMRWLEKAKCPMKISDTHRCFVFDLLQLAPEERTAIQEGPLLHVYHTLFSTDKSLLARNVNLLHGRGFSLDDIRSCPLVLGHTTDFLSEYLDGLSERPELEPYDEVSHNKAMALNMLQYLIEHDLGTVAADDEYISIHDELKKLEFKAGYGIHTIDDKFQQIPDNLNRINLHDYLRIHDNIEHDNIVPTDTASLDEYFEEEFVMDDNVWYAS